MSEYQIEKISERRTRKGRVEYHIKWSGYDDTENTWETRMDLVRDGYGEDIKIFERERRREEKSPKKARNSTALSRSRSRSHSRGRSAESKKTVGSKKAAAAAMPRSRSRSKSVSKSKSKPKSPMSESNLKSPTEVLKSVSPADSEDLEETGAEVMVELPVEAGTYDVISKFLDGFIGGRRNCFRIGCFLAAMFAMLANTLIPEIQKLAKWDKSMQLALLMLQKSTAFPPVLCLLLILSGKDKSTYSKWTGVTCVWRTAGEVLLQLPGETSNVYYSIATFAFGLADAAMLFGVCSLISGSRPSGDILTQTLSVIGWMSLVGSDWILVFMEESRLIADRFLCMSLSLIMIASSAIILQSK